MIALIYSLVGTTAGKIGTLLLVLCLMALPAVYFQVRAVSLEKAIEKKTAELIQAKATLTQLNDMAAEQKRSLEVAYATSAKRNKQLARDLEQLRKNPPPTDCKGSMAWLREQAAEMQQ